MGQTLVVHVVRQICCIPWSSATNRKVIECLNFQSSYRLSKRLSTNDFISNTLLSENFDRTQSPIANLFLKPTNDR